MVQVNDALLSALLDGIAQFVTTFVRFPEEMLDYLAGTDQVNNQSELIIKVT